MHRSALLALLLSFAEHSGAADRFAGTAVDATVLQAATPTARPYHTAASGRLRPLDTPETYTLAPCIRDFDFHYYLSTLQAPSSHAFDGAIESGGENLFGTNGGTLAVFEDSYEVSAGVFRYLVEVTAQNAALEPEPWVDTAFAGLGYIEWCLDVGWDLGGNDPIDFASPIEVVDFGFSAFDSSGTPVEGLVSFLSNTSTAFSLSGSVSLLDGAEDIAGVDVATIQIWWDVAEGEPADVALEVVEVQTDGPFEPGDSIWTRVRYWNVGGADSVAGTLDLYASTDTNITSEDWPLGTYGVSALSPDSGVDSGLPLQLPEGMPDGEFYVGGVIDVADADASNNVNFDPAPITVVRQPEVRIRPLTLDFVEESQSLNAAPAETQQTLGSAEYTRSSALAELSRKAQAEGEVRVIVGLDIPFTPEGRLSEAQRQGQRDLIRATADQVLSGLARGDARVNRRYGRIPYLALTINEWALDQLARSPRVTSIGHDKRNRTSLQSSGNVIGSPLAWAEGYDGAGQAIAILDSGVDKTHPWFTTGGAKVVSEACYSTTDGEYSTSVCPGGVASSTEPGSALPCAYDGCDHGTHVAGIAAGNDGAGPGFGVARGADIIAIQVFSKDVGEDSISAWDSDLIAGLERVHELSTTLTIAAVNMSLGGGQYNDQASCDADPDNAGLKAAIDNLRSSGIASAVSTGNEYHVDSIAAPACISSAISVGNSTDEDLISPSSNIYPEIHLIAPGTDITSAIPGGGTGVKTGTSMAAPQVAGAWAVLRQEDPAASVNTVLARLQSTATLIDDLRAGGIETGLPRINIDLALGTPRTSFGIFNDGAGVLAITSIAPETPAPWLDWSPAPPFDVPPGGLQVVSVQVDYAGAPSGESQTRLLIESNDEDLSPYAGGVYVNVTALERSGPEFDSMPAPGSVLAFGDQAVGSESDSLHIGVDNLGDANLTLGCSIIGPDAAEFAVKACPDVVAVSSSASVAVACQPTSVGPKVATLEFTTNDEDEGSLSFELSCNGVEAPPAEVVFSDGFESG